MKATELRGRRADLVRCLENRFASPLSAQVLGAIEKQEDLAKLTTWFDGALTATSLDDLEKDWIE